MKLLECCLWIGLLCANSALAAITSSPGMQRKKIGDNCTFQWTVMGNIRSYSVFNQSSGSSESLSASGEHTYDSEKGVISLMIRKVQLWDAGNYSLSVNTGNFTTINTNALLYVYGRSFTFIRQKAGPVPPVEGDTVEISCVFTSTSSPRSYRPVIHYSWYSRYAGRSDSLDRPMWWWNSNISKRYKSKDGYSTIVISPLLYEDMEDISCYAYERNSPYMDQRHVVYFTHLKNMLYKPRVVYTDPESRTFNAFVGDSIVLRISNYISNPGLTPTQTYWKITNSTGSALDLPENAVIGSYNSPYLQFTLPSTMYYGSFVYTLTNVVGNTTVTFQVEAPERKYETTMNLIDGLVTSDSDRLHSSSDTTDFEATTSRHENIGVTTSKCSDHVQDVGKKNPPNASPIVLGVLFAITSLALIGILVAYYVTKTRFAGKPSDLHQMSEVAVPSNFTSRLETPANPDVYQALSRNDGERNQYYAKLSPLDLGLH